MTKIPVNIKDNDYNPTLYMDLDSISLPAKRYCVTSRTESMEDNWLDFNQFCVPLTIRWLQQPREPGQTFGFPDLSPEDQQDDAKAVSGLVELDLQTEFAKTRLSGSVIKKEDCTSKISSVAPGTKIWFGTNRHVQGAILQKDKSLWLYDSNVGRIESVTLDHFKLLLENLPITTIVIKEP